MAAGSTTIFFIANFLFFEFTGTVSVCIKRIAILCHKKEIIDKLNFGILDNGIYFSCNYVGLISIYGIHVKSQIF